MLTELRAREIAREVALQQIAAVAAFMLDRLKAEGAIRPIERAAVVEILDMLLKPACSGWPPWDGSPL